MLHDYNEFNKFMDKSLPVIKDMIDKELGIKERQSEVYDNIKTKGLQLQAKQNELVINLVNKDEVQIIENLKLSLRILEELEQEVEKIRADDIAGVGAARQDLPRRVEPDPDAGGERLRVADEPGVAILVGGAGLARGRQPESQLPGLPRRARVDHVGKHRRHQERRRWRDRLHVGGFGAKEDVALGVLDAAHQLRLVPHPGVGERAVGRGHVEERDLARPERQRRHRRHRSQPELLRVVDRGGHADHLEHAHGGAVARRLERGAHGELRAAGVALLGRPLALQGVERLVEPVDEARRRVAAFERGRIHERLERRSRLAPGLHGAVEMALREAAPADQGPDLSGPRVERHHRRLQRRVVLRHRALADLSAARRRVLSSASDFATDASAAFCIATSMVV